MIETVQGNVTGTSETTVIRTGLPQTAAPE